MKFAEKPFGTFRNKVYVLIQQKDIKGLRDLWKETYDYLSLMEHELLVYNKETDYKWPFVSYRDHIFHETNRISGNIISTIKNYEWYLKENMDSRAKTSEEYLTRVWLNWESYLQSLEFMYIYVIENKEKNG